MSMVLLLAASQTPPPPVALPSTFTSSLPSVEWECTLDDGVGTKIAGTFGAIEASPEHPITGPVANLTVRSDPAFLMTGEINRQSVRPGGLYFFQFWDGRQVRPFTFDFRNLGSGTGTVKYWAGSLGSGICRVRKLWFPLPSLNTTW